MSVVPRENEHNAYAKFSGGETRCIMRNAQIMNKVNLWWNELRVSTCCGSIGKKIIFTSRKCVEEWKLAVAYHLHGQTIHFTVYNFTRKSHLSGNPVTEKWPQKPEIGIKDGFEEMEHKFPCGTFWDRQHLVASKVFFYRNNPKSCVQFEVIPSLVECFW